MARTTPAVFASESDNKDENDVKSVDSKTEETLLAKQEDEEDPVVDQEEGEIV